MAEIANFLSIKPPSATFLINKLIKLRLVKRIRIASDRRKTKISLTSEGKKIIEKEIKNSSGNLKKIFSCLDQKEQRELIKILTKIRSNK
ncbi:MAG: MarR family transcriptional regulator [Nitrospiraceae bacterium]|nr:MarR family transcriptional regulator [Nitrospiraceae bacterium]